MKKCDFISCGGCCVFFSYRIEKFYSRYLKLRKLTNICAIIQYEVKIINTNSVF